MQQTHIKTRIEHNARSGFPLKVFHVVHQTSKFLNFVKLWSPFENDVVLQKSVCQNTNSTYCVTIFKLKMMDAKEDIGSVPQCTMLLCYSGSTSHNAQCFYDNQDQFSQFSPHYIIHVRLKHYLKDTVWIAKFSWFISLFGIFKVLLSLHNLNC